MSQNSLKTNRAQFLELVNTVKVTYDSTIDGNAVGTVALPFKLNPGEIVKFGFTKTTTAFASGGAATIGIGFTASAQELLADTVVTGYATANANKALIPVGTAGAFYENTTANVQTLTLIIKVAALTAGAMSVILDVIKVA
jgi:hypothetical protein